MKRGVKTVLTLSAVLLIAAAIAAGWLFSKAAPIGTGFVALGFQEQKVIVIPSKKLVLVRFGATSDRKTWNTNEFINNVLASLT
jgi:hypothetical protein